MRSKVDQEIRLCGGAPKLTASELKSHLNTLQNGFHRTNPLLLGILKNLIFHPLNKHGLFSVPVDPIVLHLPTYFSVITEPMDLGTIRRRLEDCYYTSVADFVRDVTLVFTNALKFNPRSHPVYTAAETLLAYFNEQIVNVLNDLAASKKELDQHKCNNCSGNACPLCYSKCLEFQVPVLRCSAPCRAKISRNSEYYRLGGERGQYWCQKCYEALDDTFLGLFGQKIEKDTLEERIHDEVYLEPWIECQQCRRWVHQVCALYNDPAMSSFTKQNGYSPDFICPLCAAQNSNIPPLSDNHESSDEETSQHAEDSDQHAEDSDQHANDSDQPAEDSDQHAKDSDQHAKDSNQLSEDESESMSKPSSTTKSNDELHGINSPVPEPTGEIVNVDQLGSVIKRSRLSVITTVGPQVRQSIVKPHSMHWYGAQNCVPRVTVRVSPRSHLGRSSVVLNRGIGKLKLNKSTPGMILAPNFEGADVLEHCSMSLFLEKMVRQRVIEYLTTDDSIPFPPGYAQPQQSQSEALSIDDANQIAQSLQVRVVSNLERVTMLDSRMNRWVDAQYASANQSRKSPQSYPHRSKVILVMQRIDGVDVIVFVVYMQEYGADCPEPNRKKVYISYLDSVSYIQPRRIRSVVYHEVLVSYFHWVKVRGFEFAYIWACPPRKGDAYIIFGHPPWQRTPSAERLRKWYNAVIDTCIERKIVMFETNLHSHYFTAVKSVMSLRGNRKQQASKSVRHNGRRLQKKIGKTVDVDEKSINTVVTANIDNGVKGMAEDVDATNSFNSKDVWKGKTCTKTVKNATTGTEQRVTFKLDNLPIFQGDYIPTEIETILSRLGSHEKTVSGDRAANLFWKLVWGEKGIVYQVPTRKSSERPLLPHQFLSTVPKPLPVYEVKPAVDLQELDWSEVMRQVYGETNNTTELVSTRSAAIERDDWIMRNVAGAVYPMKDNFMILQLAGEPIQNPIRRKHSRSNAAHTVPGSKHKQRRVNGQNHVSSLEQSSISSKSSSSDDFRIKELREAIYREIGVYLENDTSDPDPILPPSIFGSRLELLDICQINNLQFDQLRRAKHSSIVLLGLHQRCMSQQSSEM